MVRAPVCAGDFPVYTKAEFAADRAIHVISITVAGAAGSWLLSRLSADTSSIQVAAAWVYVVGLLSMLLASAAYNMTRASRLKAALRRIDRCMIFVMIAGTYTPFALGILPRHLGIPLGIAVWNLAGLGIVLEYAAPRIAGPVSLPLYFIMGWLILVILPSLIAIIGLASLLLLVAGGIVYSLGSALQAHGRLLFHNAVWHAMVLLAAGLHFTAIALMLPLSG